MIPVAQISAGLPFTYVVLNASGGKNALVPTSPCIKSEDELSYI